MVQYDTVWPSYVRAKIEYMVALFDNQERNVKLSLRQTEILAKLQAIVSDIASECGQA